MKEQKNVISAELPDETLRKRKNFKNVLVFLTPMQKIAFKSAIFIPQMEVTLEGYSTRNAGRNMCITSVKGSPSQARTTEKTSSSLFLTKSSFKLNKRRKKY